jgi:hypothetical protein
MMALVLGQGAHAVGEDQRLGEAQEVEDPLEPSDTITFHQVPVGDLALELGNLGLRHLRRVAPAGDAPFGRQYRHCTHLPWRLPSRPGRHPRGRIARRARCGYFIPPAGRSATVSRVVQQVDERINLISLGSCGIGSCGVPRPSLAPYVAGTGDARGRPLPKVVRVAYPLDELLAKLRSGGVFGEAVISPASSDFLGRSSTGPRSTGFVLLCSGSRMGAHGRGSPGGGVGRMRRPDYPGTPAAARPQRTNANKQEGGHPWRLWCSR